MSASLLKAEIGLTSGTSALCHRQTCHRCYSITSAARMVCERQLREHWRGLVRNTGATKPFVNCLDLVAEPRKTVNEPTYRELRVEPEQRFRGGLRLCVSANQGCARSKCGPTGQIVWVVLHGATGPLMCHFEVSTDLVRERQRVKDRVAAGISRAEAYPMVEVLDSHFRIASPRSDEAALHVGVRVVRVHR